MEYPHTLQFNVEKIFGNQEVQITLYSGLTILVGTNASGKTQTLKKIRDIMKRKLSFFWMNLIPRCRKRIFMDIGMSLLHLSEVCLMQHLRQIHI